MIEIRDLSKWYGSVQALDALSTEIAPGETVGLLGPNGAGKTTLLRILAGYHYPTDGAAAVCGHDVVKGSLQARLCVGYLPESVPLYEDLIPTSYLRYRGRLKGVTGSRLSDRVETVLSLCGLEAMRSRPASALSKGYRKRLGLADALLGEPDVLLLDEPTEGLDPNQVRDTRALIRDLQGEITLLLSSHILSDVERTCDRVLILNGGRLVYDGGLDVPVERNGKVVIEVGVEDVDPDVIETVLGEWDDVHAIERVDAGGSNVQFRIAADVDLRTDLFELCADRGWTLNELGLRRRSLETLFTRSTE